MRQRNSPHLRPDSQRLRLDGGDSNSRGAGILEWAIALPFIFLVVLGIIDLVRYQTAKYLAQRGALDGVHAATRVHGMQFDIRGRDGDDNRVKSYLYGRNESIKAAVEVPGATWFKPPSSSSSVRFFSVLLDTGQEVNAVVLRPGERYRMIRSVGGEQLEEWVDHPTLCHPDAAGVEKCKDFLLPEDDYEDVLLHHPIAVYLYGIVEPIIPLMPAYEVKGFAVGYREQIRRGLYPDKPRTTWRETPTTTTTTTIPECAPPSVFCHPEDVEGLRTKCRNLSANACDLVQVPPTCCECRRVSYGGGRGGASVTCPAI